MQYYFPLHMSCLFFTWAHTGCKTAKHSIWKPRWLFGTPFWRCSALSAFGICGRNSSQLFKRTAYRLHIVGLGPFMMERLDIGTTCSFCRKHGSDCRYSNCKNPGTLSLLKCKDGSLKTGYIQISNNDWNQWESLSEMVANLWASLSNTAMDSKLCC